MSAGELRRVLSVRRGAIAPNRNGTRTYAFARVVLDCGHVLPYPRLRIAVAPDHDSSQFERELRECRPPTAAIAAIPLRLIL